MNTVISMWIDQKHLGRKKKKKKGEEEWDAIAQEDFFKASEKELEERERKRKEREEEEAKREQEQVDSNLSISILRKKGNDTSKTNESAISPAIFMFSDNDHF